jgi:methylated-DNA-[protein]-cysteine S-methyltransferase
MKMTTIQTPIGPLNAVLDDEGRLVELGFSSPLSPPQPHRGGERARVRGGSRENTSSRENISLLETQLAEYFSGQRRTFDFELAPRGTPFQLAVWNALLAIAYGETISYAELAHRIGKPAAVRAVGAANGANPIPVIIPCHRVIGSNGSLTGYGGGIERKQWLLALEGRRLF